MTRDRLALIVFTTGAIVCIGWAAYKLLPLADYFGEGGGFIGGAFSSTDGLIFVAAPLIVFALSRRVRSSTGLVRGLRLAHIITTLAIVAIAVTIFSAAILGSFANGIDGPWIALLIASFIGGALWLPLQGFFATGFLSLLITERREAS